MKCKEAEKSLLRSWDERLNPEEGKDLEAHLAGCDACRRAEAEYRTLRPFLLQGETPGPLPRFWERLAPRLEDKTPIRGPVFGIPGRVKAAALVLAVVVLAAGVSLFLPARNAEEMSQSEILFLRDENPLAETQRLLEEKKLENKNIMLIFASSEESAPVRRYLP